MKQLSLQYKQIYIYGVSHFFLHCCKINSYYIQKYHTHNIYIYATYYTNWLLTIFPCFMWALLLCHSTICDFMEILCCIYFWGSQGTISNIHMYKCHNMLIYAHNAMWDFTCMWSKTTCMHLLLHTCVKSHMTSE